MNHFNLSSPHATFLTLFPLSHHSLNTLSLSLHSSSNSSPVKLNWRWSLLLKLWRWSLSPQTPAMLTLSSTSYEILNFRRASKISGGQGSHFFGKLLSSLVCLKLVEFFISLSDSQLKTSKLKIQIRDFRFCSFLLEILDCLCLFLMASCL